MRAEKNNIKKKYKTDQKNIIISGGSRILLWGGSAISNLKIEITQILMCL